MKIPQDPPPFQHDHPLLDFPRVVADLGYEWATWSSTRIRTTSSWTGWSRDLIRPGHVDAAGRSDGGLR